MAGYFFRFVAPKIAKNLTGRFKAKQDMFKTVDKAAGPNVSSQKKSKIKKDAGKIVSKIFDKSEKAKKKIKEIKALTKAAGATSVAGISAAGAKIIKDKK